MKWKDAVRVGPLALTVIVLLQLASFGCATKKYVNRGLMDTNEKVDEVSTQVEANQSRISDVEKKTDKVAQNTERNQEELNNLASETERLKKGKLLFKVSLSSDKLRFETGKAQIGQQGQALLDDFAERLKQENKGVWIEIEGHTDSRGDEQYNHQLGLERAESVRRYLAYEHGIPLHRMSVISYGETKPVADNDTAEGREQNRRVVLMVLE